jgi:polyisoprenoid-binding protein YceI
MKYTFILVLSTLNAAAAAISQPAGSQAPGWKLDKVHSSITFSVKHMVISEVAGKFGDFDITFTSSKDDFSDASVESIIKVASINTEVAQRDGHLKSDDFFNAEKFPEIRFKSTSFQKTGDGTYKITGDMTIRDITKPVTFDAVYNGSAVMGNSVHAGWKATTFINRFDFGLKWNRALETGGLIVSDKVNITLNLELVKTK